MNRAGLLTTFLISVSIGLFAQEDDRKIVVEITKEINGEKKTFHGEYGSAEEMKADPNYRKFAGEEGGNNFWFDGDNDHQIFMDLNQLKDIPSRSFHFFSDSDSLDEDFFFFQPFDSDSGFASFNFQGMDWEKHEEKIRELGIEMEEIFKRLDETGAMWKFGVVAPKRIKVEEDTRAFGKRGKTAAGKQLELQDLRFSPNPSLSGKLRLRFTIDEPAELQIFISNLEGKNVYSRYFERFSGIYSESIDLSDQREGIYLLEIVSDGNTLSRQLVIE